MRHLQIIIVAFSVLLPPALVSAGWVGPSDYDECILDSMKGVTSDKAALLIVRSCRAKFPSSNQQPADTRVLSNEELLLLTGRAGISSSFRGFFSGTIYNGNKNITVTEIKVRVSTTISGKLVSNVYTSVVNIEPETTGTVSFHLIEGDAGANYPWTIAGAVGH